ncbi:MAG: Nif3-like dinuclear metal center hexameric protein [Candidatus Kapabacteria bacterium]|nr:Nif3-like dinuclear metal center hexameric protein [Candidatus Kapabacteria bacterium]
MSIIEKSLPASTAMANDRIGLQIQSGRNFVKRILITLEVTPEIIKEAIELGSDCIITFHPLIFNPILSITENERVGQLCSELIRNNIALVAIHTNFDSFIGGTSKIFADKLDLINDGFLIPDPSIQSCGMGILAHTKQPVPYLEFIKKVSEICNSPIRYCEGKNYLIERIAIVGGSGSSFLNDALKSGADAFITADITYHTFHRVQGKMMIIDPGHYEMEQFVPEGLQKFISENTGADLEFVKRSKALTNPVRFFPEENFTKFQQGYLSNN